MLQEKVPYHTTCSPSRGQAWPQGSIHLLPPLSSVSGGLSPELSAPSRPDGGALALGQETRCIFVHRPS